MSKVIKATRTGEKRWVLWDEVFGWTEALPSDEGAIQLIRYYRSDGREVWITIPGRD